MIIVLVKKISTEKIYSNIFTNSKSDSNDGFILTISNLNTSLVLTCILPVIEFDMFEP